MLENLVCSLEMGKRLKAAGWNQPTEFMWVIGKGYSSVVRFADVRKGEQVFHALLAEEVLRELPCLILTGGKEWRLGAVKGIEGYHVAYNRFIDCECTILFCNKSLAEAACEMWLWCKEKGYVKHA